MNIDKGLDHLKRCDKKMARLIVAFGVPDFQKESNYFEALVRAIIYQQLSGKAAATIYKRFKTHFPGHNFPTPEAVLATVDNELRTLGLSKQKTQYIHNIAQAFTTDAIPTNLDSLSDSSVIKHLTAIKGIGPWTAEMFLMFTLNRTDVFSVSDLGLQKGFKIFYQLDDLPQPEQMLIGAERWRPYRTLAAWYLWRLVEGPFEW